MFLDPTRKRLSRFSYSENVAKTTNIPAQDSLSKKQTVVVRTTRMRTEGPEITGSQKQTPDFLTKAVVTATPR